MNKILTIVSLLLTISTSLTNRVKYTSTNLDIEHVWYEGSNLTVITIKKDCMDFSVVTENHKKNDFYLNSNFFTTSGTPIGEVISNGKKINNRVGRGGFFYTINGKPMISYGTHPKRVENSSQTNYVGIINGKINEDVTNVGNNKQKEYRTLMGMNSTGDLVVIVSGRFGRISMGGISKFGITRGIKLGLIFDGGSSVDVGVCNNKTKYSFKSMPNVVTRFRDCPEPPVYIVGNFK
jgi:hypothetical protein